MAKSLRSKWKRKMRAIKRVRYGEKELNRLNEMLTKAGDYQLVPEIKKEEDDANSSMVLDSECTVIGEKSVSPVEELEVDGPRRSRSRKGREPRSERSGSRRPARVSTEEDEEMAVDKEPRVFSKRTMRDQYGNYPVWMNKRKMITQQKKNKRINKRRAASVSGKKKR